MAGRKKTFVTASSDFLKLDDVNITREMVKKFRVVVLTALNPATVQENVVASCGYLDSLDYKKSILSYKDYLQDCQFFKLTPERVEELFKAVIYNLKKLNLDDNIKFVIYAATIKTVQGGSTLKFTHPKGTVDRVLGRKIPWAKWGNIKQL